MKVAIVTGGSGGIGRCTARSLAEAQCRVFEFSRHEVAAEGVEHITCDVTDEDAVRAAVAEVGAAGRPGGHTRLQRGPSASPGRRS